MNEQQQEILKFLYPLLPENIQYFKEDLEEIIFRDHIHKYLDKYFEFIDDSEDYDSIMIGIEKFLIWVINEDYLNKSDFIIDNLNFIAAVYNMSVSDLIDEILPLFHDNAWILVNVPSKRMRQFECFIHCASSEYRDDISKNGLQAREKTDNWLTDTPLSHKQKWLFLTLGDYNSVENDMFETGLDYDIWLIDMKELPTEIKNRIYFDPNIYKYAEATQHCVTPLNIPPQYIKLYYEGSE